MFLASPFFWFLTHFSKSNIYIIKSINFEKYIIFNISNHHHSTCYTNKFIKLMHDYNMLEFKIKVNFQGIWIIILSIVVSKYGNDKFKFIWYQRTLPYLFHVELCNIVLQWEVWWRYPPIDGRCSQIQIQCSLFAHNLLWNDIKFQCA